MDGEEGEKRVEHVITEGERESEAVSETAAAAVATAGAAVSLANETAASAELQAAERVAEIEREAAEWRTQTHASLTELADRSATHSEMLAQLTSQRDAQSETLTGIADRLSAIEARLNPTPSTQDSLNEATTAEPLAGAEATASLAGAEVSGGASLGAENETEKPSRREKRWI